MKKDELIFLFGYNRWANTRVLAACAELSEEQLRAPAPVSFGSVLGTLAHVLGAEMVWRKRLHEGISPERMLSAADVPGLDWLAAAWREEEAAMQAYLAGLEDADLAGKVRYTRLSGEPQETVLWQALMHVILHGMQFRGEAGAALAALGSSPGDLDFIVYVREQEADHTRFAHHG